MKKAQEEKTYEGQFVSSKSLAEFDPNTKYWTVTTDVQEGRKVLEGDWEFKTISVRSMDTILPRAQDTVIKALYNKMQDLKNDLWNLPDGENDVAVRNVFEDSENPTT
jgi:hypothetical protein